MPDTWAIEFEPAGGDTTASATVTTWQSLRWERASITLRRRAPHELTITIPRTSHHRITDFIAGREWRLSRNGVYWQTGLMNAASLPGGRQGSALVLPAWGSARVLTLHRGTHREDGVGSTYGGFDVDGLISNILDNVYHVPLTGPWFPFSGRTIYSSSTAIPNGTYLGGRTALEQLNDLCDVDGVAWRVGITSSGAWTFTASATVEVDRSATLKLYDGANCEITDVARDGSEIIAEVLRVASKRPLVDTRLSGAHAIGATTITVDKTEGLADGDVVVLGVGTANEEQKTIASIVSATQLTLTAGLGSSKADNDVLKNRDPHTFRSLVRNPAASVHQAHHTQHAVLYNDAFPDTIRRQKLGDAHIAAYNHVLAQARVTTSNSALITQCLDAGLEPGDTISLTSGDQDLSLLYNNMSVKVQEMSLELEPGRVVRLDLLLGDPAQDTLALLERRLRAAQMVAVSATAAV